MDDMEAMKSELNILRFFFNGVIESGPHDNTISDAKLVRHTKTKLRVALRNVKHKCSCARRFYGMCEVCEASRGDIVLLRIFFREICNAKKHKMTVTEIQEFIENSKERLLLSGIK